MFNCYDEIGAAEQEEAGLVQAISHGNIASPSICAYMDSAGWVKQLPTRVVLQPLLQQVGLMLVQGQCFCSSQKSMLSLNFTPCSMPYTMLILDSRKLSSSSSDHSNVELGLSSPFF